jgi:hypothetical protein
MKIRKVCNNCGGTDVVRDAWSSWDEDTQEWVLDNVFDYEFCQDCESETTITDAPATEDE